MSRLEADSALYQLLQITEPSELKGTKLWWLLESTKLRGDVDLLVTHKFFVRVTHPEPDDEEFEQDPLSMYGDTIATPVATYTNGSITITMETAIKDDEGTLWVAGKYVDARLVTEETTFP